MKIYFAASASEAVPEDVKRHKKILDIIKSYKHDITNPFFASYLGGDKDLKKDENIFDDLRNNILSSDCLIAEITVPSVSLGIQIEYALSNKVPVLCLLRSGKEDKLPLIIRDYKNALLLKDFYNDENLKEIIENFLSNFPKSRIKFNMFISQEIDKYLAFLVNKHNKPKSEIIRNIITDLMKNDSSYSA